MSKYVPICLRRDLRGKRVELRNGEIVTIPEKSLRDLWWRRDILYVRRYRRYVLYVWHSPIKTLFAFDVDTKWPKFMDKVSNDITKVY